MRSGAGCARIRPLARGCSRPPTFAEVRDWIRLHHERPDGTGYPEGLHGDEVPLEARIIAVADAYEAMTSERPYRGALGAEEAAEELRQGAGKQFDERVVEALLRVV